MSYQPSNPSLLYTIHISLPIAGRVEKGRVKPIDNLSYKHLNYYPSDDDFFDIEIALEPYVVVFKGLTVKELEDLHEDIKMHLDLDRATPTHIQYWEALLVVCDWELAESRKKDALLDRARAAAELLAEEQGLHSSIETDVKNLLQGKTYAELEALQSQIESQMQSGTAKVVDFWEAVIKRFRMYKAKACLKEIHARILLRKQPLGSEDNMESITPIEEEDDEHVSPTEPILVEEPTDDGSYSPELLHGDDQNDDDAVVHPEEDRGILEKERISVLKEKQRRIQEAMAPSEDNLEMRVAMKAMGAMEEGDAVFGNSDQVDLDSSQVYRWHDKFRPRKPKYFNRVHTGYEWNKYNQTHYDHDNPPPKLVQGYKFNIFFPDRVDKIKAPLYTIEKDGDSVETCIIRFHAGPPYQDIGFRIVNKEWEYSHKKGII